MAHLVTEQKIGSVACRVHARAAASEAVGMRWNLERIILYKKVSNLSESGLKNTASYMSLFLTPFPLIPSSFFLSNDV